MQGLHHRLVSRTDGESVTIVFDNFSITEDMDGPSATYTLSGKLMMEVPSYRSGIQINAESFGVSGAFAIQDEWFGSEVVEMSATATGSQSATLTCDPDNNLTEVRVRESNLALSLRDNQGGYQREYTNVRTATTTEHDSRYAPS